MFSSLDDLTEKAEGGTKKEKKKIETTLKLVVNNIPNVTSIINFACY